MTLLLPAGVRMIHIGPHKTGTTAIQGAFHSARERLADFGVLYAGSDRQPMRAAISVTGRKAMLGEPRPDMAFWQQLVDEVDGADATRTVISSEFFADGDADAARRVVTDLGGPRAHVVVTLRPLARILQSQWQQYVQNGLRNSYHDWLDGMFNRPPYTSPTATFWHRHRHDALIRRWVEAAGDPSRVTVIVVDDTDPGAILCTMSELIGVPDGVLRADDERPNRSLTWGEVEMVRLLNREFKERGWSESVYARFLRYGAVAQTRSAHRPSAAERIVTPDWALERAATIGASAAEEIGALGVRVVGDLASLGTRPVDGNDSDIPSMAPEVAAQAVLGAIIASGAADPDRDVTERPVGEVSSVDLARTLLYRVRRRAARTIRPARRHTD